MSKKLPAWAPYVIPFAVYLALTAVEVRFPGQYPALYSVKIFVSALLAWIMRPQGAPWPKINWAWILAAVAIGVLLNWVWFAVDKLTPHPQWVTSIMGKRASFNPFLSIVDPLHRNAFLAIRFAGLVLVVPYLEEMFYRVFVLRWIANPDDFQSVPVGTAQPIAIAVSTVLFASTHPEYLSAAVFGLVMCALVRLSKDIRVCMLAHGATNLALGLYVISTGSWGYW